MGFSPRRNGRLSPLGEGRPADCMDAVAARSFHPSANGDWLELQDARATAASESFQRPTSQVVECNANKAKHDEPLSHCETRRCELQDVYAILSVFR